jgi:hypothetical protein
MDISVRFVILLVAVRFDSFGEIDIFSSPSISNPIESLYHGLFSKNPPLSFSKPFIYPSTIPYHTKNAFPSLSLQLEKDPDVDCSFDWIGWKVKKVAESQTHFSSFAQIPTFTMAWLQIMFIF